MQEHVHSGIVDFLITGFYAWLFLNLLRIGAIKLGQYDATRWIAASIGGTLSFGNN